MCANLLSLIVLVVCAVFIQLCVFVFGMYLCRIRGLFVFTVLCSFCVLVVFLRVVSLSVCCLLVLLLFVVSGVDIPRNSFCCSRGIDKYERKVCK